jgi:hypothetical protein
VSVRRAWPAKWELATRRRGDSVDPGATLGGCSSSCRAQALPPPRAFVRFPGDHHLAQARGAHADPRRGGRLHALLVRPSHCIFSHMQSFTAVIERDEATGLFVGYVPGWPASSSERRR